MNKTIADFIETLDDIITDSEMDSLGEFQCDTCKAVNGDEEERNKIVRDTGQSILEALGEEAHSQFVEGIIQTGGHCTSRPEFCDKYNK